MTAALERHFDSDPRTADEHGLLAWFRNAGSVLIGFSGGVDSAYLACVAVEALGPEHVLAVIGRSTSYPEEQWSRALGVARHVGIPVLEVDTDEISDPRYAANSPNRCYFCKTELWSRLVPIARARGLAVVVDGTNADDVADYRPGRQAAEERGIRSPLAELGFGKEEIRRLSAARGLPTWSAPSSPCLSSRLPYGLAVTPERLRQVERAEAALRTLGVTGNLRVRHHGDLARVELDDAELSGRLSREGLQTLREAVAGAGFARVTVELGGFRSGSLNLLEGIHASPASAAPTDPAGIDDRSASVRRHVTSSLGSPSSGPEHPGAQPPHDAGPFEASPSSGSASRLASALHLRGYTCTVEGRDRLAVVTSGPASLEGDLAGFRNSAIGLAREFRFTHIALEIPDRGAIRAAAEESRESGQNSAGAAVPGD